MSDAEEFQRLVLRVNLASVPLKFLLNRTGFVVKSRQGVPCMKRNQWIMLAFLVLFPIAAGAQQADTPQPLTPTQKTGQRIFQQRCGVCHSMIAPAFPMYGPALYKGLVEGNEDAIRQMIREGTSRMPGFQFGLQAPEIDAIVEYLKTLPKPANRATPAKGPTTPMD
jgi:mono/diheme cytochrome c family protein